MGLFDYIFNIVRDFNDFLHILIYLVIAIFAFVYGVYKSDKELYNDYIYSPFKALVLKKFKNFIYNILPDFFQYFINIISLFAPKSLRLASNRLPYYTIAIKNKSNILFSKINETKQKIKKFFNMKK